MNYSHRVTNKESTSQTKQIRMYSFYFLVLFTSLLRITIGAEWCYEHQFSCDHPCKGPTKWAEVAEDCGKKNQSPINIVTKKVTAESSLTQLGFRGYDDVFTSGITNNGHTVKVNLSGHALVEGGGLEGTYKAMELHFHWGKNGGPGSEHTVDGEQFPMEMHVIHIKDKYSSVSEAIKNPSGVAVLGFLYQESGTTNTEYETLINALVNVIQPDSWSSVGPLSLKKLIPSHKVLTYFRYNGSLTTPNCTEGIIWTVFENPILLSKQQLHAFSGLKYANGSAMVETFRPVQPLNGRHVFYFSGSNMASVSNTLFISAILTMLWTNLE